MNERAAERRRPAGRPHAEPLTIWVMRLLILAAAINVVIRL
jgi:hypothetical protein